MNPEFLRGFAETCGAKDPEGQWAAWSRQLTYMELKELEAGGYEQGYIEGKLFSKHKDQIR